MASGSGSAFLRKLRNFDAYPKTLEDFRVKTYTGAAVSIISSLLMFGLFVSELNFYLSPDITQEILVDTTRSEKLRINVDITFPRMPCAFLSIDVMDVSGEQQLDVFHTIYKKRLSALGIPLTDAELHPELGDKSEKLVEKIKNSTETLPDDYCGSCYGAEGPTIKCCNTCEQVREAYRLKGWAFVDPETIEQCMREGWVDKMKTASTEGCAIYGYFEVSKVAGNFHFAPGKSFQQHHVHVHDLQTFKTTSFNLTHYIDRLSFGKDYPGIINPLDGVKKISDSPEGSSMYQYFLKVVPTIYRHVGDESLFHPFAETQISTNQFSATQHHRMINHAAGEHGLPGVFFMYDLSPMLVKITYRRRSFLHFLTSVCAIVGGIFTTAGLIDSFLYHGMKTLKRKMEIGKHT